ncbi:MAG: hypothetical protein KDB82_06350 [Planctomycetes bacterium]|nr:hypothetical protein [Planctomycetota bacterium]
MGQLKRNARKGSILGMAMLFFVMVTVAGAALLSMSTINRMKTVRNGVDVRLMIAAEAGMETIRGRFTLVSGVQDDWSWLTTGTWTTLDTISVNDTPVTLQANLLSGSSVPTARVRGIATASGRTRAVEQTIKVASFSDYARFSGSTSVTSFGANFKMVGTCYYRGGINLGGNGGIQFLGQATTSGVVSGLPTPEGVAYNFPAGYIQGSPVISIPSSAYGTDPILAQADALSSTYAGTTNLPQWDVKASGFHFYRNTISLEFFPFSSGSVTGTQVVRRYYYRESGNENYLVSGQYSTRSETITLPQGEEICLYVDDSTPPLGYDCWNSGEYNYEDYGRLDLSGTLRNARITVCTEMDCHVVDNVNYYTLLQNPSLRLQANKTSSAATSFTEMLGVVAQDEVLFDFNTFSPYNSGDTGYLADGVTNQYHLDGTFLGTYRAYYNGTPSASGSDEFWGCGCLIGVNYPTTGFGGAFGTRHYDWDWRLQSTTPPFFLRAYNVTATFVPGTWRTYEM